MILLCLSGLNLMEGKLNKEQLQGSLQNLMMPKLNRWAETSHNPSAKLIQQLCIYMHFTIINAKVNKPISTCQTLCLPSHQLPRKSLRPNSILKS